MVVKRDGTHEPWDRQKVLTGIGRAIVNRPVTDEQVAALVDRVETRLRRKGPAVSSEQVGLEVLQHLQRLDEVGYLRFASVYMDFQEAGDFQRELGRLRKKDPAKSRTR